jgi:hypothetical protein
MRKLWALGGPATACLKNERQGGVSHGPEAKLIIGQSLINKALMGEPIIGANLK